MSYIVVLACKKTAVTHFLFWYLNTGMIGVKTIGYNTYNTPCLSHGRLTLVHMELIGMAHYHRMNQMSLWKSLQ